MRKQQSPLEIVSSLYALFADGRLEETFDLMHSDVVLYEPGDPSIVPWAGTHVGHAGLNNFYEGLGTALSEITIDEESLDLTSMGPNRVLAVGTERGVSSKTGRSYETCSAWLWTVREGRIAELRAFHDTAAMSKALQE